MSEAATLTRKADFPGLLTADGQPWHYLDTAASAQAPVALPAHLGSVGFPSSATSFAVRACASAFAGLLLLLVRPPIMIVVSDEHGHYR